MFYWDIFKSEGKLKSKLAQSKWSRAALTTFATVMLLPTAAFGNLIVNPGFETGDFTGWTTSNFGVSTFDPHSGTYDAGTGCVGNGCVSTQGSGAFLSQVLATTPGQTYTLDFLVGEDGGPTSEFTVFWNGSLIADVLNPANNTLPGYVEFTYNGLLATTSATTLEVHGRQDPAGIYFDDFSVNAATATPEPGQIALVAPILAALYFVRLRKA